MMVSTHEPLELPRTAQFSNVTDPRKRSFIAAYAVCGRVGDAAKESGVSRRNHSYWMLNDPDYKSAFQSCRDLICAQIEDSLVERLIHGWEEPVYHNGQQVGSKPRYDNAAALRYLTAVKKDVFGNQKEDLSPLMAPVNLEDLRMRLNANHAVENAEANVAATALAMQGRIETPSESELRIAASMQASSCEFLTSHRRRLWTALVTT